MRHSNLTNKDICKNFKTLICNVLKEFHCDQEGYPKDTRSVQYKEMHISNYFYIVMHYSTGIYSEKGIVR